MPDDGTTIAYCHACGGAMDVTAVAPFSNVACPACGKHTRVKREFGPYTLTRRHAIGGMSMVFVAHDNTLDREVALKILSEEFSADERRIAAFEEEARITASLSHPHIVRVFTTGRAFGRFYIAMELVPGGHFEHQIRERGKIPEDEMLPIAIEVAAGLQAAHAAGLIHRDVKPGNILLDADGHAKLVDFGLALVTHGGSATATELWATPYYVPPETIEGQAEDFRSDMYAFGATLYHALSGVPSCAEETMVTDRLREAKRKVKPLEEVDPRISADTCEVVNKAMAYSPGERFASYGELIARLEIALTHLRTGTARTSEPKSRLRAEKKRRERMAMAVGAAALLLLAGTAAWIATRKPAEPHGPAAGPTVAPAPDPDAVPPPETGDASALIAGNYREARAALESGDYKSAALRFLDLHHNPEVQEPTRTWAAVEAAVASYLSGDPAAARGVALTVANHTGALPPGSPGIDGEILAVLRMTSAPEPIPVVNAGLPPARVLGNMIAGLKNWHQGMLDRAAQCFTAASEIEVGDGHSWLGIYQRIAADHLHDHAKLTGPLFAKLPDSKETCESSIDELNLVLATLRTAGRARFNVRAWQLDIARHAKLLGSRETTSPPAAGADELLARISSLSADYRFAEAVELLRSDETKAITGETRESLLAIEEAARQFLTDMEADLRAAPARADLALRDGSTAAAISLDESGSLQLTTAEGATRPCAWSDLPPDALISLHRTLVKLPRSEAERLRRHERAIAFDWLAGNRERALAAASALAQTSSEFKERWESLSAGLPR